MRFRGELGLFGSVRRFAWRVGADVVLTFRNAYGSAWGSKNRSCTGARVTFHQPRPTLRGLFEVRNASRIATHVLHTIHRLVYQGSVSFIYQNLIDPPPARSGSESRRRPRTKGPPNHSNVQVIAMVAGREPRCAISHSHQASATPPRCGRRRTGGVLGWARAGPRSLSRFQQTATLLDTSLSTRGRTSRYEASLRWPAASSALQCSASAGSSVRTIMRAAACRVLGGGE